MVRRTATMLGLGAALAGGAAAGFLAERVLIRGRFVPSLPPTDQPLGSLEGERTTLAGPRGTRIEVEAYGPVDAPQLVLAHGWVCTGRVWHEQVRRLAVDHRLITYDQPGHGRSSAPEDGRYDVDLLGDTFVEVVASQARPGPVIAVGHSLGGMAVLNAARRHQGGAGSASARLAGRLGGTVLLSTTSTTRREELGFELGLRALAGVERSIRRVLPTLRDPRLLRMTERMTASSSDLSYLVARWTAVGPDAAPEVAAFTQALALSAGADVVLGLTGPLLTVDEDAGLDALSAVPTTLVVGTHDRMTPASLTRRMAARSQAGVVELERVGHMAHLEAGERVSDVLRRHVSGAVARDEQGRWELAGEADGWRRPEADGADEER